MENKYNKIKNYYNKNKILIIVYLITVLFTALITFKQLESFDIKNVILCFLSLFLLSIMLIIDFYKKINVPNIIKMAFILFIFSTIILGEVNNFYEIIPIWDDILHIVLGFFASFIGFILISNLFKDKDRGSGKFDKLLLILFSFSFAITISVIWEVLEYKVDCNVNVDMQKDNYVYKFSSVLLNPKKNNEVMVIDNIGYTTIYDESGKKLVTFNGYLDIGNKDTMDDLIDTVVGALLFEIIGCLYLFCKNKYKIVKIILLEN